MSEEIKFEKAIERLEKIVEDLESGNISLEDALKKYEEGVKLSRLCHQHLSQAEKKIQVLTRTLNGGLQKEPFEVEEEGSEKESKPSKAKTKTAPKQASAEEDLLF